ncbi:MAG: hypothetical protein DI603_12370 [Roseateles depolymerans]|uniref:Uncharacterized protein n=1 Tax=Roseateles depolymerans TaxID=76731 RepID=A0A2W5DID2_9BURK|nr:MAG: hypothetical protein DI603_12370 [Roseateles depolymerans]
MSPPDAGAAVDPAVLAALRAWCEGDASSEPGASLRVASIASAAGLDGAACALDGSHELSRLGLWRGLLWRLQILARECLSVEGAPAGLPWDCGWWRDGAIAAAQAFRPRRSTLLMVRAADGAAVTALRAVLEQNWSHFRLPVCVLVVSDRPLESAARLSR